MTPHPHRTLLTTALALGPLAVAVPAAGAATTSGVTSGSTTVALGGAAYDRLARADVRVRALGDASRRGSALALPVWKGVVGDVTLIEHGTTDGLILEGADDSVRITSLRVRLGTPQPRAVGRIDGGRLRTLFTLGATGLSVDRKAGTATRTRVTWRLTAPAARTLRGRLDVPRLRSGRFGTGTLAVRLQAAPTPGTAPPATGVPTPGTPSPGTSTPAPGTTIPAPAVPDGATLAGTVDWGLRASFRNYIGGFAKGKVVASDGATINADGTYRFAPWTGTVDPTTGAVSATSRGTVSFEGHGAGDAAALRLWLRNPRIEAPAGSTVGTLYADVTSKSLSAGTNVDYPNVRFATLDLTAGARTTDGTTVAWAAVPAKLTQEGVDAFAGFYEEGAELDPVSLAIRRR